MSGDRDRLAEALWPDLMSREWSTQVADALLPVVDRIANERAAAALRDADVPGLAKSYAADRVRAAFHAAADEWPDAYASSVSDWLRDRADALDGEQ